MAFFTNFLGLFRGETVLAEKRGEQYPIPGTTLVDDTRLVGSDGALQIAAVWSCVERRASVVASLPLFVYRRKGDGQKTLDRASRLYTLLHDTPNARMTPFDFWRAMMMNYDLRGNAYARIDRDETGEAVSLWPMPADQVTQYVLEDGTVVYSYRSELSTQVYAASNVLHIKGLGNGTVGLSRLEFMRATTDEAAKSQQTASRMFGSNGKPTGVLMIDRVLSPEQRDAVRKNFGDITAANTGRLFVLEASMEYKQLSLSPEDQELLESRKYGIEEVCRWFDVPPVLVHHSNVTTWGSGIDSILDGWYKLSINPLITGIEQAIRKQVLTPAQRVRMHVEFSLDALLRGNLKDRMGIYATGKQNGIYTTNEVRQFENLPPMENGDELTVQSNLVTLERMVNPPPPPLVAPSPADSEDTEDPPAEPGTPED